MSSLPSLSTNIIFIISDQTKLIFINTLSINYSLSVPTNIVKS